MKSSFLFLSLFAIFAFVKRNDLLDVGQDLFFSNETSERMGDFTKFQVTTWNNLILKDPAKAHELCKELRTTYRDQFSKIMCESSLSEFAPMVKSYLSDQFLIFPAPTQADLSESAANEIAKLSMLMGPEAPAIMEIMRLDPMNEKEALMGKVQNLMLSGFEMKDGLLTSKADGRIMIAVQFSFPAFDIDKTEKLLPVFRKYDAVLLGPHEGHATNRRAIENDLGKIGIVGFLTFGIFIIFVTWLRMWKLIKLMLPAALGICFSFLVTWLVYGKVHGITVSFGTGIIGLAIDYGFHYIFSKEKGEAWKSNLYALLTSLLVFLIFLFSSVPLIRQMMFFSTIGLAASYVFSRILLKDDHIDVDFHFSFKRSEWHGLGVIVILLGVFHIFFFKVDTSLQRFNYSAPEDTEAREWFYSQVKKEKLYFKIYKLRDLPLLEAHHEDLKKAGIRSETVLDYVPSEANRNAHLASWLSLKSSGVKMSETEEKVFEPFLTSLRTLSPDRHLDLQNPPGYLSHLVKKGKTIGMWFPNSPEQEAVIRKWKVTGFDSMVDIFVDFTNNLSREVTLFIPITILAIWLLLFFRYRDFKRSFFCLVPFLFSLGFYGILYRYFGFPLSFMSLLGLFLIYGVSVDYGIFSTDFFTNPNRDMKEESSLNLSLLVNWISGIIGFLPLLWCDHPVLDDLGLVLVLGMVGIFYSTFFMIPALFLWSEKK